jgi:cob(I)alamin adenosyltransferase
MGKLKKGYVQVYTGDGKGKTTAALGLALRAVGNDFKVFIAQFIKGLEYCEIKALKRLNDSITVKQYGRGCFIQNNPTKEDIAAARNGLCEITEVISSGKYDLVILDEINIALHFKILTLQDVLDLIEIKPDNVELVLTGRRAEKEIIDKADLVTEMREVKHYFTKGVMARKGIER